MSRSDLSLGHDGQKYKGSDTKKKGKSWTRRKDIDEEILPENVAKRCLYV
jgi:hypothetical protein